MTYRTLDPDKIEQTIGKLHKRVEERFPGRGLAKLCAELLTIAHEDQERMSWRARPNRLLRAAVGLALIVGGISFVWTLLSLRAVSISDEAFDIIQGVEAILNVVVLAGASVWFLLNLESRMRREQVLADLHELRSIAHVVDMHQLTKDPMTLCVDYSGTASSEPQRMSAMELVRYLDYCTELLALTGKLAALYLRETRDAVIIQTVNEIEELTTNLSRKIWQKIIMLRDMDETLRQATVREAHTPRSPLAPAAG